MAENPYLDSIRQTLPRLLSLFDSDATSVSHGMGDRFHWAWGLIDFGNATFQGAAHGMARLWRQGLWPYATSPEIFLDRIDALFEGARRLTRKDGSLEEAFPYEGSFCVTALVAFDLLCALDLLRRELPPATQHRWRSMIEPMIVYLRNADETHAFISNHLATAAAALVRWHALSGDLHSEKKAKRLIERILAHQSEEGWFKEYEGADPGYQSLCTYYLADVHLNRPDWQLGAPLGKSIHFLWHFAHPDGSFGGLYGSRCTRFYFPAGIEALARDVPAAAALAAYLARSIAGSRVVTLTSIDEPNLIPLFNAYCWAAALWSDRSELLQPPVLPALRNEAMRVSFPDAGLCLDIGPRHYTVVSAHKGGVVAHFVDGQLATLNAGVVVRGARGSLGSSQALDRGNAVHVEDGTLTIEARIRPMPKRLPTPAQFLVLRLLCVSLFRSRLVREWAKAWLVRLLIEPQRAWPVTNLRRIRLGQDLDITDDTRLARGYVRLETSGSFISVHMASQGYWQIQDETGPR
jgi:hypothetical protein